MTDLFQLRGIVDKESDLFAVFRLEMLSGRFKGLIDAFPDGDARDDNDEFAPAVAPVQLLHRFDVSIGFSRAGLHLNGEIVFPFQFV